MPPSEPMLSEAYVYDTRSQAHLSQVREAGGTDPDCQARSKFISAAEDSRAQFGH